MEDRSWELAEGAVRENKNVIEDEDDSPWPVATDLDLVPRRI